jgi:hypothetical protein
VIEKVKESDPHEKISDAVYGKTELFNELGHWKRLIMFNQDKRGKCSYEKTEKLQG